MHACHGSKAGACPYSKSDTVRYPTGYALAVLSSATDAGPALFPGGTNVNICHFRPIALAAGLAFQMQLFTLKVPVGWEAV